MQRCSVGNCVAITLYWRRSITMKFLFYFLIKKLKNIFIHTVKISTDHQDIQGSKEENWFSFSNKQALARWMSYSPVVLRSLQAASDTQSEHRTVPHWAQWISCWPLQHPVQHRDLGNMKRTLGYNRPIKTLSVVLVQAEHKRKIGRSGIKLSKLQWLTASIHPYRQTHTEGTPPEG